LAEYKWEAATREEAPFEQQQQEQRTVAIGVVTTNSAATVTLLRKYQYASYIDDRCVLVDLTALGAVAAGTEELFWQHANHLYSVAALTDAAANLVERYTYDAYGNLTILDPAGATVRTVSSYGNPYTFTGRRLDDETGLYHYRARYYDSELGRFVSRDSLGYVDGLSLYRGYFVPNGLDPFGLRNILDSIDYYLGISRMFHATAPVGAEKRREGMDRSPTHPVTKKYQDDAGSIAKGYFINTPVNVVIGCWEVVIHPLGTAEGVYFMVTMPREAFDLIKDDIAAKAQNPEGQGELAGEVVLSLTPAQFAKLKELKKLGKLRKYCCRKDLPDAPDVDLANVGAPGGGPGKPSGSYTNTHASGKTYDGKGDKPRSQESGRRIADEHNDPHIATDHTDAPNSREAFKDEARRLEEHGGPDPTLESNYNKIESPGKKYLEEDGQ
jgi:RHS repeat-associated protein